MHKLHSFLKALTRWQCDRQSTGRKVPRKNYVRMRWCPACVGITDESFELTGPHVLQSCEAVTELRETLGVKSFTDESKARGHSLLVAYSDYVNGSNPDGSTCNRGEHRRRGGVMEAILEEWLSCW